MTPPCKISLLFGNNLNWLSSTVAGWTTFICQLQVFLTGIVTYCGLRGSTPWYAVGDASGNSSIVIYGMLGPWCYAFVRADPDGIGAIDVVTTRFIIKKNIPASTS